MCTFNRNNRECIHKLKADKKFIDFTEEQDYYMCNDELNIAGIVEDDLVKFRVLDDSTFTDTKRIYGFVKYIQNVSHTTFMICLHYDENGVEFMADYVYSSFYHAFKRLNHIGSFYNWEQLTNIQTAYTPKWFADYWLSYNKIDNQFKKDTIENETGDIDYEDVNQYEQTHYYNKSEENVNKDILEQINKLNEKIEYNTNKIQGQLSELSNRINIVSKLVINTDPLDNIINKGKNRSAYSTPKMVNHVIC